MPAVHTPPVDERRGLRIMYQQIRGLRVPPAEKQVHELVDVDAVQGEEGADRLVIYRSRRVGCDPVVRLVTWNQDVGHGNRLIHTDGGVFPFYGGTWVEVVAQ